MNSTVEMLSYGQFMKDSLRFRRAGTNHDVTSFNTFDFPSHKYFKILFYFGNTSTNANEYGESNGLLHPTWEIFNPSVTPVTVEKDDNLLEKIDSVAKGIGSNINALMKRAAGNTLNFYDYNSAWSYLKLNDENERAEKLEKFVKLLSNINCYSPWYFTSIGGLDAAMERKGPDDREVKFDEAKKLTITCIPDSFDNRIGTLLELYRDVTWSWVNKREVIPANLRKFDMAIYIFESPIQFWHDDDPDITLTDGGAMYKPSYKMIEFHDCEFSYNSIKSGYTDVNSSTGFKPTYTIEISYNDCYEISYNEHLMRTMGDVIETDMYQAVSVYSGINKSHKEYKSKAQFDTIQKFLVDSKARPAGFIENAVGQLIDTGVKYVKEKVTSAVLGNLYTYSLTEMASQLSDLAKGNIIKTGQTIAQYAKEANQRKEDREDIPPSGNLANANSSPYYKDNDSNIPLSGEIFDSTPVLIKGTGKSLGNLYQKIAPSSIANN